MLSTVAQSSVTLITVFQRERQSKSLQSQQYHNNDYELLIALSATVWLSIDQSENYIW